MPRWNLAWLVGIAGVACLGLAISQSAPSPAKETDYELVRLVVDVLGQVDQRYVRELDADAKRKLVEDMINGGLERLDPHSQFINERRYQEFKKESSGHFGGVGIRLVADRQTGLLMVESPLPGTPAYEAGVLAGDLIIKIDGKSADTMHMDEAVAMIQGPPGKKITLTVVHEGAKKPVDIAMERAEIKVQSVMGDLRKKDDPENWDYFIDKKEKIAYVRLSGFTETAADELRKVVQQLQAEGVRGLILDLRMNPGGLLSQAVEVSDLFLENGRIVSTRGRNEEERVYDARPEGTLLLPAEQYPMAVLINKYSASASEIVAAALQDHGRAVIIGERSFGKGSVQNVLKMEGGKSALKLTTASYWRPSGKNIHRFPDSKDTDEWGVKPDKGFDVKMTDEDRLTYMLWRRDRDVVQGKPGAKVPPHPKTAKSKKAEEFRDRVLEKAVEHLRKEVRKVEAATPAKAG
jgi:carboxyl-terminal processing protease